MDDEFELGSQEANEAAEQLQDDLLEVVTKHREQGELSEFLIAVQLGGLARVIYEDIGTPMSFAEFAATLDMEAEDLFEEMGSGGE